MEDRDWLILQELYRMKNITKAAQELYMSQPALTSRLQHIEREFNVRIVTRSTKGIRFTQEGEYLVKKSSDLLEELAAIKNEVHELDNAVAGTIEIGASNYFTLYTLPTLLEQFQKQHPAVKYLVTTDWSKNISNDIYQQKLHIGFVSVDYGYTTKHMLYDEPYCIAYKKPFTLEEVPELPRIDYLSDYLLKAQIDRWWRENFNKPPITSMQVGRLESCKHMVSHGLGYSIIPYRLVAEEKAIHTLLLTEKSGKVLTRTSWMLYNDNSLNMPTVKAFVDFVQGYDFRHIIGENR